MKNISSKNHYFCVCLLIIYIFLFLSEFSFLAIQFNNNSTIPVGIRIVQILLPVAFLCFFLLSIYYHNHSISFILILSFQIVCSSLLWSYYYFITKQPLGFDANDAFVYQQALEKSLGGSWTDLVEVLKSEPRTASLSDWGFPTYRFFIYKLFPDVIDGIFALVITNCIVHTVSSLYVYKLASRFLDKVSSIVVMSLWGLSASSIHVNTCGLKETIFSFFVVLSVYHLIEIKYKNKIFHTILFFLNVIFVWFFRNYVSIFLILVYIGCYPFRKIFYKWIVLFVIGIFLVSFLGTDVLAFLLPPLKWVKISRDLRLRQFFGNNILIANIMNFCFAWVAPIPRFNETAEIKQVVFSGYSIFTAFFSLFGFYGILNILRKKVICFYPLITFLICNIVLIIVTCYSLDFRFQHPTSFIYDILIVFGFSEIHTNGIQISGKTILSGRLVVLIIFSIMFLLVFVYNYK